MALMRMTSLPSRVPANIHSKLESLDRPSQICSFPILLWYASCEICVNMLDDLFLNEAEVARCTFLNLKCFILMNLHTFSTRCQPESNLLDGTVIHKGKPYGGCPGGDIEWLNTGVINLGNNCGLLSFACCLKTGKRFKIVFSGLFVVFSLLTDLLNSVSWS